MVVVRGSIPGPSEVQVLVTTPCTNPLSYVNLKFSRKIGGLFSVALRPPPGASKALRSGGHPRQHPNRFGKNERQLTTLSRFFELMAMDARPHPVVRTCDAKAEEPAIAAGIATVITPRTTAAECARAANVLLSAPYTPQYLSRGTVTRTVRPTLTCARHPDRPGSCGKISAQRLSRGTATRVLYLAL